MSSSRSTVLFDALGPYLYSYRLSRSLSRRLFLQYAPKRRIVPSPWRLWASNLSAYSTSTSSSLPEPAAQTAGPDRLAHLDPLPSDYSLQPFIDRCSITLQAGNGGNGCVAFLREKYIPEGPPNGGDGGNGGNIFIQAVRGETSLHKLARRPILKAGKGGNGKGKGQGGERGTDVLFTVPVGTVVREVERFDPLEEQQMRRQEQNNDEADHMVQRNHQADFGRDKWMRYPGEMKPYDLELGERAPPVVRNRTNQLAAMQPKSPIRLDLDQPMDRPMLLVAGAVGGLGNPHFVTKDVHKPKFATKGEVGTRVSLNLELKVLADVGLVGLPNAGKSTLLRALTNSRTRVGDWSFTTLQPSVGTVVLDNHAGRPLIQAYERNGNRRDNFTIADIPGLIQDAHLDKGLGLGFLRHVERAAVLAFVVDLSAGDAVQALKALWHEVTAYETMRAKETNAATESRLSSPEMLDDPFRPWQPEKATSPLPPISSKPWLVVATKADLPGTEPNFQGLRAYINLLKEGQLEHPSKNKNAWRSGVRAVPVSAIREEGVNVLPKVIVDLLE